MSWVLNGYTVVYAAMLIPSGGLADAYGRKRMFLTGVALFLAASAACGLAGGVGWLVAARVAQAVGAALLTPASLSIVLAAFPVAQRTVAVSLWGAVAGLAAAVGPSLGAFVVDAAGWPWASTSTCRWARCRCGAARACCRNQCGPSRGGAPGRGGHGTLDPGRGRGGAGHRAVSRRPGRPASYGFAAAVGAGALAAFVAWARVAPQPLVDLALFQHRSYRYANLATLSFGIAFAMMFFAFFFYMMGVWHYSLPKAGLAVTPGPLLVMPTAIVTGRLAARMGHRPFLVGGALRTRWPGCGSCWCRARSLTIWAPGCRAWC